MEHLKTESNLQDTGHHQVKQNNWVRVASKALKQEQEIIAGKVSAEFGDEKKPRDVFQASLTGDGEEHAVYKPGGITNNSTPQFAKLVFNLMQQRDQEKGTPLFKANLKERQLEFKEHIKTTQEVIKEQTKEYVEFDEMDEEERKAHLRSIMAKVSARLQEKGKQQATAANVFSDALTKLGKKTPLQRDDTTSIESMASSWRAKAKKSKPAINPYVVAMSVNKFKNIKKVVEEEKQQVSVFKDLTIPISNLNYLDTTIISITTFYTRRSSTSTTRRLSTSTTTTTTITYLRFGTLKSKNYIN